MDNRDFFIIGTRDGNVHAMHVYAYEFEYELYVPLILSVAIDILWTNQLSRFASPTKPAKVPRSHACLL